MPRLLRRRCVRVSSIVFSLFLAGAPAWGQQIVRGPTQDRPLTGSPEMLYAVGAEEGEPWETFGNVAAVSFDRQGNLYVLDRDNGRVNVFGPDGSYQRMISQKGEGPGELVFPMAMTVTGDGRLVVHDMGSQGLSVFTREGEFVETVRPQFSTMGMGANRVTAYPKGGVLMQGSQMSGALDGGPPVLSDSVPIFLQPLGAGDATVLYRAPVAKMEVRTSGTANARTVNVSSPPRFSPEVYWAPLADGRLAVVHGTEYAVNVARADGTVGWVLTRPIEPRPVEEADREAERERTRERMASGAGMMMVSVDNGRRSVSSGGGAPPEQIQAAVDRLTFAETMPVVRGLRTDLDGRFWIRRDAGPGEDEPRIDLLAANGGYFGTLNGVAMPDAFGPDGRVAYIEENELGVQQVVVRRIPAAWRP